MTYLWRAGVSIVVDMDDLHAPLSFNQQGNSYVVTQVLTRWRVDEDWWNNRVWREYFKLITRDNRLVILFRDLHTGNWYLQRDYD